MDEIYSEADQVIVWLGAEDAETEISIYMISMFSGISKRILAEPQDYWDYFEYRPQERLFSCGMPTHIYLDWWEMLARFLDRPWFGRLWTLQEVALKAKPAEGMTTVAILCGSHRIAWEDIVACSDVLGYTGLSNGILNLLPGQNSPVGRTTGTYSDFQDMCHGKKFFELQHEQLWGLTPHARVTGMIEYTLRDELLAKSPAAQNVGAVLLFLVSQSKRFKASNPRDKVFALLGMARRVAATTGGQVSQLPSANYDLAVEDVYYDAFRFIMETTQLPYNIAFVGDVGAKHIKGLPSWVLDLTSMTASSFLTTVRKDDNTRFKAAGSSVPPPITIDNSTRTLTLYGFLLDTIPYVAEPNVEVANKGNWNTCARMLLDSPPEYFTGQPRLEAFWRTFIADQMDSGESPVPETLGESFFQTLRFALVDKFYKVVEEPDFEERVQKAIPKIDLLGRSDKTGRVPTISSVISDCKKFAEPGSRERNSALMRDAEKQSLFIGNASIAGWRRTFRTSKGYLGLGPESLETGDQVFVIAGSPVPFAFRPTAVPGRYRLVGEAYIHGMMHGEAMPRSWEASWEPIHLE